MIAIPHRLIPWAQRIDKILTKPYPPKVDPHPDRKPQWEKFGNWSLICEDVLDTEPDPRFLRMCYDELRRRGLDDETIQDMHRFAWLTVGWLNYEKMLWEWVHLDQKDVELAVEWLFKDNFITSEEQQDMLTYIRKYGGEPSAGPYGSPAAGSPSGQP